MNLFDKYPFDFTKSSSSYIDQIVKSNEYESLYLKYDNAISDFKKALELIDGAQDQIEPDGLPNKQNIPLTT